VTVNLTIFNHAFHHKLTTKTPQLRIVFPKNPCKNTPSPQEKKPRKTCSQIQVAEEQCPAALNPVSERQPPYPCKLKKCHQS
jgi:hypothetical protein